jgi:hypothetical protein
MRQLESTLHPSFHFAEIEETSRLPPYAKTTKPSPTFPPRCITGAKIGDPSSYRAFHQSHASRAGPRKLPLAIAASTQDAALEPERALSEATCSFRSKFARSSSTQTTMTGLSGVSSARAAGLEPERALREATRELQVEIRSFELDSGCIAGVFVSKCTLP